KLITIKSSISEIGWKPEYLPRLEKLVHTINTLMIHIFALIKFIFISELKRCEAFDIEKYAEKDFYIQVFFVTCTTYEEVTTYKIN
ncbi:uncharacterized protein BX663DRAFT_432777, partial [Cokeromyces recurvatus]|uniref:uncharacterized protein n=1 Tax=Cokeromyces recurvatus TaxID=90255 RepID=UPI00221F1E0D